jgi:hypothetical protein
LGGVFDGLHFVNPKRLGRVLLIRGTKYEFHEFDELVFGPLKEVREIRTPAEPAAGGATRWISLCEPKMSMGDVLAERIARRSGQIALMIE